MSGVPVLTQRCSRPSQTAHWCRRRRIPDGRVALAHGGAGEDRAGAAGAAVGAGRRVMLPSAAMRPVRSTVTDSGATRRASWGRGRGGEAPASRSRAARGRGECGGPYGHGNLPVVRNEEVPLVPGGGADSSDRHRFGGESASAVVEPSPACPGVVVCRPGLGDDFPAGAPSVHATVPEDGTVSGARGGLRHGSPPVFLPRGRLPRGRASSPRASPPRTSSPPTRSRGGTCCATARSSSTTPASCSPTAVVSRPVPGARRGVW